MIVVIDLCLTIVVHMHYINWNICLEINFFQVSIENSDIIY